MLLQGLYEATSKERLSPVSFYKLKSLKLEMGVDQDCMQVMILLLKYSPNLEVLKLWSDECRLANQVREHKHPDGNFELPCMSGFLIVNLGLAKLDYEDNTHLNTL
ncbi:hypothetical protein RND71_001358 [Anisodus tanguticus]|uniref:Uncharacterized protein n=1 Tax=Anisodus tanguticus TaxID=243964 RepID=A0AAE1VVT1_9SOLA|nr:hypothetical protein RND71_001358 [Anisodus tanguticus]